MKWGLSFGVMLYQIGAELVEPMAGIEPATDGLRNRCSTTELHWRAIAGKDRPGKLWRNIFRPGRWPWQANSSTSGFGSHEHQRESTPKSCLISMPQKRIVQCHKQMICNG